jgi:murein L,D-transpeptidase YcbB/YkuD
MERWRWIPDDLGERHVAVNIPAFQLYAVDAPDTVMTMRVIAGSTHSRTELFADEITYMELNPAWNVPESIASGEIVPKVQEDPEYLLTRNFIVYDEAGAKIDPQLIDWTRVEGETLLYRFTQAPGVLNPLGSIKFMFPNPFNIYLHDTSKPSLFSRESRLFSHGCIRLEKPLDFAAYLLQDDPEWTGEEVEAAIKTGQRRWIHLPEAMPIYLLYLTAFVDGDGSMAFRRDAYGHDQTLADALRDYTPPYAPPDRFRAGLTELQTSTGH